MPDWDERYRRGEHSPAQPHQLLVKTADTLAAGRALDLACGAGRHAIYLASKGWKVTAVDNSRMGLEIAGRRANERGVTFETILADLEQGDFAVEPGAYDLICVFYYLQRDLFPSIKDGLRTGGVLVAAIHIVDNEPDAAQMNPDYLLKAGELKDLFAGWHIEHYREGRRDDPEHKHRDAEIIARKPGRRKAATTPRTLRT